MTYTYKLARRIALLRDGALLSSLALAAACSGSDLTETDPGSQAPSAALLVIPQVVTIETNQTVSFAARDRSKRSVAGTVQWAVSGGRISHDGAFNSSEPGTFMLMGRVQGEREQPRAGTARVRVVPAQTNLASIRVVPERVRIAPGAEQTYEVTGYLPNLGIQGTVPIGVTWTASGGKVDASGVYTAGDAAGTFSVIATSVGTGVADTVWVVVDPTLPPPVGPTPDLTPDSTPTPSPTLAGVVLTPSTAALQTGVTQEFAATGVMSDGSPAAVTFSYSATGGSITPEGLYRAGTTAGTYAVIARAEGGTMADTAQVTITAPVPTGTKLFTGTQSVFDTRSKPLAAGVTVNADKAIWTGKVNNPINWAAGPNGVWRGGTVTGTWNQATTQWDAYHSTAGMHVRVDNVVVENFRVHNYGDGIRFMDPVTKSFTLRGAWFSDLHDDGVENDRYKTGLVEDSFLDGVYVAFSGRPAKADYQKIDGRNITYTVRNNLVRLKAFAHTAAASNTSGGFFKVENREPARNMNWVVEGNVFRADAKPGTGTLCLNQQGKFTARNNVIVWLGAGDYPCTIPPGWTLTRDVKVWDNAVAAWKARRP